jgi:hypothetical protein
MAYKKTSQQVIDNISPWYNELEVCNKIILTRHDVDKEEHGYYRFLHNGSVDVVAAQTTRIISNLRGRPNQIYLQTEPELYFGNISKSLLNYAKMIDYGWNSFLSLSFLRPIKFFKNLGKTDDADRRELLYSTVTIAHTLNEANLDIVDFQYIGDRVFIKAVGLNIIDNSKTIEALQNDWDSEFSKSPFLFDRPKL